MTGKKLFVITTILTLWGGASLWTGASSAAAVTRAPATPALKAPSTSNIKDEHLTFVKGTRSAVMLTPSLTERQLISRTATGRAMLAAGSSSGPGFLTRPYSTWHDITSVFDHCTPDYSTDGRVCEFDGSVGLKSNGVDPSFSLGYAQTPGGGDYLYYDGHNGWDYALAYENVLAAADGVVQLAGSDPNNPCFGQTIILQHPNGYSTRYAHLSAIYVSPGQSVGRAQVIAQSGNTGCSSGPHLHFGVYVSSSWTAIDPWGWWGAPGADPWPSDPGNLWLTGTARFPVPDAPTNVSAVAGNGSATISWTPPAFDGGTNNMNYLITASPGGAQVSAFGVQTSAVFSGLSNGTSYTFTVTAVNSVGSVQSAASNAVTPTAWMGHYRTVSPARLLDTRSGLGGFRTLGTASSIDLTIAGHGGLPASGVSGVVLNVTAVNAGAATYVTAYPSGLSRPATSNLNLRPGATVANLVQVGMGSGGDVTFYNNAGSLDLIVDLVGWYSSDTSTAEGLFVPTPAARILDTRSGTGSTRAPIGTGQAIDVAVAGQAGIPASGAAAVLVNLTAVNAYIPGNIAAFPSGIARPSTSTVNYVAGQTVANRAIVPIGSNGKITLFNCCGSVDAILDVTGWFSDASNASLKGGTYFGLAPARVVDTRVALGGVQGPVGAGVTAFPVAGLGGLPATPRAVIANVTVTDVTAYGHRIVYPNGTPQPTASDLNVSPGTTVANLVMIPVGADGKLAVYSYNGNSDVLIDIVGYYN